MNEKNINLITSGLDSLIGYLYLKFEKKITKKYINLYVDMGSRYSRIEYQKLLYVINNRFRKNDLLTEDIFDVITTPIINETFVGDYMEAHDEGSYYKNRNLLLVIFACSKYSTFNDKEKNININLFNNADDRVVDGSYDYYQKIVKSNIVHGLKSIDLPLKDISKLKLVDWFLNYDFPKEIFKDKKDKIDFLLNETYSCYSGLNHECLNCKACFRKSSIISYLTGLVRPHQNEEMIDKYIKDDSLPKERKQIINKYIEKINIGRKTFGEI